MAQGPARSFRTCLLSFVSRLICWHEKSLAPSTVAFLHLLGLCQVQIPVCLCYLVFLGGVQFRLEGSRGDLDTEGSRVRVEGRFGHSSAHLSRQWTVRGDVTASCLERSLARR